MSFLSSIGSGLKKVGSVVGKGLSTIAPVASLIPGVGTLGALGMGALGAGLKKVTATKPATPGQTPAAPVPSAPAATSVDPMTVRTAQPIPNLSVQSAPAAPAAVAAQAPPVAGTTAIDPGNGLRGRRIDTASVQRDPYRLQGASEYRAAIGNTDVVGGAAVDPSTSARAAAAQSRTDAAANALATGPDRVTMARQQLADFDTQLGESRALGIKGIGQDAARFGRVGSGVVTGKLADLERTVQRDRTAEVNRLTGDLAERDAQDRFTTLSAFRGVEGDAQAQDATQRSELRGERAYRDALASDNVGRRMSVGDRAYSAGEDRGQTATSDALTTRAQLQDERAYEDALASEAYGRTRDQLELQNQYDQQDFARGLQLDGVGYAQDPTTLQFGAAGRRAAAAGDTMSNAAGLIGQASRDAAYRDETAVDPYTLPRRRRVGSGTVLPPSVAPTG